MGPASSAAYSADPRPAVEDVEPESGMDDHPGLDTGRVVGVSEPTFRVMFGKKSRSAAIFLIVTPHPVRRGEFRTRSRGPTRRSPARPSYPAAAAPRPGRADATRAGATRGGAATLRPGDGCPRAPGGDARPGSGPSGSRRPPAQSSRPRDQISAMWKPDHSGPRRSCADGRHQPGRGRDGDRDVPGPCPRAERGELRVHASPRRLLAAGFLSRGPVRPLGNGIRAGGARGQHLSGVGATCRCGSWSSYFQTRTADHRSPSTAFVFGLARRRHTRRSSDRRPDQGHGFQSRSDTERARLQVRAPGIGCAR